MSTSTEKFEDTCWSWTNSGKKMFYNNPTPDSIRFEDIACSLSKTCRFAGQIDEFYSVADHCCNLVEFAQNELITTTFFPFPDKWSTEFLLYLLLHDSAEAYMGDCPAPAKWVMPDYRVVENRIFDNAIAPYFKLSTSNFIRERVKFYDRNIIRNEAELLFNPVPDWVNDYIDIGATIKVSKDHKEARDRFTALYVQLVAQRNGLGG